MSWEDINDETKPELPFENDIDNFCRLCYDLFVANPQGKEFLSILGTHLNKPVCPPDKEPRYGYWREGQNSLIRQIGDCIRYHKSKGAKK